MIYAVCMDARFFRLELARLWRLARNVEPTHRIYIDIGRLLIQAEEYLERDVFLEILKHPAINFDFTMVDRLRLRCVVAMAKSIEKEKKTG